LWPRAPFVQLRCCPAPALQLHPVHGTPGTKLPQGVFVFTGPPDKPDGTLFKPVLHGVVTDLSASIAGTVTPASTHATILGIQGVDTVAMTTADTLTGAYTLRYLPAGTYILTAVGINLLTTKTITVRAGQDTTGVNFPQ
jgi:hypothetical protein